MTRILVSVVLLLFGEFLPASVSYAATARGDARPVSAPSQPIGARPVAKGIEGPVVRELSSDLIEKSIQKYLEREWKGRVQSVEVNVLSPSEAIRMPSGVVELRVVPDPSEETLGRRLFRVIVTVNGKPLKTIEALADVAAMTNVVSLNRFFKSDELIGAEDVKIASVRINQLNHPFITNQDEVIGKGAARPLQADTPLRPAFLKKPLTVRKGERVIIEARRGGLSIHTYGVTKSNGYIGETIMVANSDSGRELRAKIVASGLVQVEF
jgi:flagella basal body P-ring formation protein FlgA